MSSFLLTSPFIPIMDLTANGLNGGKVYIGVAGEDPQTNPQPVYWDAAATIPATQPLAVQGGYIMRAGTPTQAYTANTENAYSIRVLDRNNAVVFYKPIVYGFVTEDELPPIFTTLALAQAEFIAAGTPYVQIIYYAVPGDGGGGLYISESGAGPGRFQSADGQWWGLSEPRPRPEQFGANGTYAGDTAALQACCDYVRNNYSYGGIGNADQNMVYGTGREYFTNLSIDYTDQGNRIGMGIMGAGPHGCRIVGKLTDALPILDMSGIDNAQIQNLSVNSADSGDNSSCSLLMANVIGTNQHNNTPTIINSEFNNFSPNCVAAVIIQGGDLASLIDVTATSTVGDGASYGACLPALYHGYAVGAGSSTTTAQLNVSGTYDNNPAQLSSAVVGKIVSFNAGTASGPAVVRTITTYNSGTNTIGWTTPLSVAPDDTTRMAILAVTSAYQTLSNLPDNTVSNFIACKFEGQNGFVMRHQGDLTAVQTYMTSTVSGGVGASLYDDYLFQAAGGVDIHMIGGCRWENEAANADLAAFMAYGQVNLLQMDGVVGVNAASGAHIACALGGSIGNVIRNGSAENTTPLFSIEDASGNPTHITGSVRGIAGFPSIGNVTSVGSWGLANMSGDTRAAAALISIGGGLAGDVIIVGQNADSPIAFIAGVNQATSVTVALQRTSPTLHTTTGASSQKRQTQTIPANSTLSASYFRALIYENTGSVGASMSGFLVQINQASTSSSSTAYGGALTSGNTYKIEVNVGTGNGTWSVQVWDGTTCVANKSDSLPGTMDFTADFTIDIFEDASSGDATSPVTWLTQVN